MKFSITWHKDCLENMKLYCREEEIKHEKMQRRIKKAKAEIDFYSSQIALAEKRDLKEFDRDRFGKCRVIPSESILDR